MATGVDVQALAEKIDRVDSLEQIRLLASRYALALDTRNLDDLTALFIDDVRVGRDRTGRAEMRKWFVESFSRFGVSIHFIGNHVIEFDDADHAHGVVYCRDDREGKGEWRVGILQYWDNYERRDGIWYFVRRRLFRWYDGDALTRPSRYISPEAKAGGAIALGQLPEAWPSWDRFWKEEALPQP